MVGYTAPVVMELGLLGGLWGILRLRVALNGDLERGLLGLKLRDLSDILLRDPPLRLRLGLGVGGPCLLRGGVVWVVLLL